MIVPAKQERDLTRAVLSFLEAATNAIPLDRTTELLATGRIQEAVDRAVTAAETALPTTPHRIAKAEVTLAEALTRAFASGAEQGAASVSFSLNLPDVAGAGWATREGAQLVTAMTREARAAIAGVVSEGLRTGVTPAQTAFMIRQVAGLSPAQAAAVSRYYTSFLQAAAAGQGAGALLNRFTLAPRITPNAAVAERAAERYAQRLRAHRALNIARTETQRAAHAGQLEAWQQLRDSGAFGNAHVVRQWLTAEDERVCPTCGPMHLTQAELSGSYSLPVQGEAAAATQGGVVLHPPAHPSCRCDEVITLYDQARPAQDATVGPRGESRRGPSVRNQPRQLPARSGTEVGSMSRQQIIDELRSLGYDGPVSYTKPRLVRILEEQRAKLEPPKPEPVFRPPPSSLTRREILDELKELEYRGPTSYTKDKLTQILERERIDKIPGYNPVAPKPVPTPTPTPVPTPPTPAGPAGTPWANGPPARAELPPQGWGKGERLRDAFREPIKNRTQQESAERAVERLNARYPGAVDRTSFRWVESGDDMARNTYAHFDPRYREVVVHDRHLTETSYARDVRARFHPPTNTDGMESIIHHEFGHALHDELAKYQGEAGRVALRELQTAVRGVVGDNLPTLRFEATNFGSEWGLTAAERAYVTKNLSTYAATNPAEFIAEAFSEYMTSPTPRPIAMVVGRFFDEMLGIGGRFA